jgi:hypothetical protein
MDEFDGMTPRQRRSLTLVLVGLIVGLVVVGAIWALAVRVD